MKPLKNAINHLIESCITDSDSKEVILRKRIILIISLVAVSAGIMSFTIYLLLGLYLAASLPILYTAISFCGLSRIIKTKEYQRFQTAQLYSILVIPFVLMWVLGGFKAGSMVMLWAFYAPIATVIYTGVYSQRKWFSAFFILVVISVLIDDYLIETIAPPPSAVIHFFMVFNIIGSIGGIQLVMNYITKITKEYTDLELEHKATHDTLTALPNRVLFEQEVELSIVNAQRCDNATAVLVLALDRFKDTNDSFGHSVGNQLLLEVAGRISHDFLESGITARLNGDEFGIILTHFKQNEESTELAIFADKLLRLFKQPFEINQHEIYLTCSIGIAAFPYDANNAAALIGNAYTAMHRMKVTGKNDFQFYTQTMTEEAHRRTSMISKLRRSIVNDEFVVYFQPQYDVSKKKITGTEALVRWCVPGEEMIPPAEFIPLAEETGLIVELDRLVMRKAMAQYLLWYQQGLSPGILSLNLSMRQLETEDFIPYIQSLLAVAGSDIPYLALEITEGQIMANPEEAIGLLEKIADLGIKLAIDDFGTGYSSLAYLKRLPVSKLKIDQSFVRGLPDDEDDQAIVKSVIVLAKSMKMSVIAEGVETLEQSDFLLSCGCEHIQGYYYGRPMPAEELEELLS